jgi:WD40 repeat protein/transcriptional regulator with XRE-family HTH domain
MERKHSSRKRGVVLTAEGLRKLQAARRQAELADNFGDRYTLEELSERTGISLKTVTKVLEAHNTVDKPTLEAFFQAFQIMLERQDYRYPNDGSGAQALNSDQTLLQTPALQHKLQIDWGEAPDVSLFYGRQAELSQLKEWVDTRNKRPRRLIAILGMGGVGKTALATKLLHDVINNVKGCPFEYVIWRSLRNAPTLETILTQWLAILSNQQETQPSLQTLLHYLQHHRCLLVLDNLESVLSKKAGIHRHGYERYGELFRLVGETSHQSSLVVTSREKTIELSTLEGDSFPVCCLSLKGSDEASQYLLQAKGLKGTTEQQKQLCDRYSNSPLAIKIIAATIQDLFDGEISNFLQEETTVFHGIRRLLDQQFERLSNLEQAIMLWLAINRDWTTIDELNTDLLPPTARSKILDALESLHWRNLIEKKQGTYTQQSVVMEYVTERLIEQISAELVAMNEQSPILLHRYPLLKTTVKDYIRDSQQRLIVEAIARELQASLGSQLAIAQHLKACLAMLRPTVIDSTEFIPESSYAAGSILNLLCHLGIDLRGCDCSGLSVWHAYLPNVPLPQANFAHADLHRSQLTNGFGAVFAVAFSSDGSSFVSGELGGYLRRWRVNDGQAIWAVKAYNSRVHSIAVSPDDTIIAVGTSDHPIEFWDAATGQHLRSLIGHQDQVYCVAFHPTQPLLVSASGDTTIRLWDIETGTCLHSFEGEDGHTDQVQAVCFSPKGDYLVSGSSDRTIKIWDLTTQKLHQTLTGHEDQVFSVNFHPDGKRFTSGSPDGTLKLWKIDPKTLTASPVHTIQCQAAHIFSVLSPDGSLLSSSCADHTIRLWDSETMQPIHTLQAHNSWIRALQFSPDGQTLLSGGTDYTIKLWDINSGQVLKTWMGYSNWIWSVDVSRDGTKIVSGGGDRTVRVWDLATGNCLQSLRHPTWVLAVACNQDGSLVASGGGDSDVTLWQTSSDKVIKTLTGHTTQIYSLLFSPTNNILASRSGDYSIRLWDVDKGQVLKVLQGHQDWIRSMDFSPNGKLLASAGQDLRVNLWDVHTGECLQTWQDFDTWVWGVSFHPDGDRLVTASGHTPKLWNVRTGALIHSYHSAAKRIRSVAISPNGQWLAAGGQDNAIHLWNLETGKTLTTFLGHIEQVLSIKFSPDNCSLISGSADETIKIWNIQTGLHQTLKAEELYEGMNIAGVKGLSEEAIATLIRLGAKSGN